MRVLKYYAAVFIGTFAALEFKGHSLGVIGSTIILIIGVGIGAFLYWVSWIMDRRSLTSTQSTERLLAVLEQELAEKSKQNQSQQRPPEPPAPEAPITPLNKTKETPPQSKPPPNRKRGLSYLE